MTSALVLVLSMAGFGLLLLGERMGIAPGVAYAGVVAIALVAALALGVVSMTSRIGRFLVGEARGGAMGLAALVAMLAILAAGVGNAQGAIPGMAPSGLLLGFLGSLLIVPFNPWRNFGIAPEPGDIAAVRKDIDPGADTRGALAIATIASGIGVLALLALYLPGGLERAAEASGMARDRIRFGALGYLVLIPVLGGMLGVKRVAKFYLAIALIILVLPVLLTVLGVLGVLGVLAGNANLAISGAAEVQVAIGQFRALAEEWILAAYHRPDWVAIACGVVLGFLVLQPAVIVVGSLRRLVAILVGLGLALSILWALRLIEEQSASMIAERIIALPPGQWPLVVFDEALRGWLTVCGQSVQDAIGAANACGLSSARLVLPPGSFGFQPGLAAPAASLLLGWPVVPGFIWGILPSLMGLTALGFLVHAGASALGERILFRWANPGGPRAWRLAMVRILAIVLGIGCFELDQLGLRADPLALRWLLLGSAGTVVVAMLGFWLIRLIRMMRRRASRVVSSDEHPSEAAAIGSVTPGSP